MFTSIKSELNQENAIKRKQNVIQGLNAFLHHSKLGKQKSNPKESNSQIKKTPIDPIITENPYWICITK